MHAHMHTAWPLHIPFLAALVVTVSFFPLGGFSEVNFDPLLGDMSDEDVVFFLYIHVHNTVV